MEEHIVRIKSIEKVTHDVLAIRVERPAHYNFIPGQATEVAINKPGWTDERRPFTFTCLPTDKDLEFTIKTYPARKSVTNELRSLKPGDELLLHDVWGAISYKGKGVFIAGGAGITPFLSIFRYLHTTNEVKGNKLIFANKTKADIIREEELQQLLGNDFINILSDEEIAGYAKGFLTASFLKQQISNFNQPFYVCGPPPMMDVVLKALAEAGASENSVVVEI